MQRAPLHLLPLLLLTLAACSSSSTDGPPQIEVSEPEATRADPEPTPPTPTPTPTAPPTPSAGPPPGARTIRPLGPGILNCIEMYSACTPDPGGGPPSCTSAPYHLDCGQSGHVPGSTETLYCACP